MTEPHTQNAVPGDVEPLLERYLSGDAFAFEQLVGLYQDRLYGYLERFLGDAHLAEDVFQQTFLKVAEKVHGFDHRSSFSTWLFAIARNTALDEMRHRRRTPIPQSLDRDNSPEPIAKDPSPLEALVSGESKERILAVVAELPPTQREAFLLKEEADLGFQEIADIIDCPKETVKSRFRLAVEKIRLTLITEGFDPGRGSHA